MARRPAGVIFDPIASDGRLLRHVRRHAEHKAHLQLLLKIAEEVGGNVAEEQARHRAGHTAADNRTLRGIPAVGPGCSSAMPGTQPESALLAKQRQ